MIIILQILLWGSVAGMLSTYLLYPATVIWLGGKKKQVFSNLPEEDTPVIDVIFAAYNEQAVLEKKIRSVLNSHYPADKLRISIGSDNSTDETNIILEKLALEFPERVFPTYFKSRQGKSAIINQLAATSQAPYLLPTDANIIFTPKTVYQLAKGIKTENVGACGGQIIYEQVKAKGIAQQESVYLNFENKLKFCESKLWGITMGLEGGCYLIKRELFPVIPDNYFMEDFFVTLSVLEKGYQVVFNPTAVVTEDVSVAPQEEFNRKVRISIGNWQNLEHYQNLIFKRFWPLGFSFLGHKVFRWFTPFFLLISWFTLMMLMFHSFAYQLMALAFMVFILLAYIGVLFSQGVGGTWLKYPGHFIYMNLALLKGFIQYKKGVKSNAWQPTKRNQD